MKYNKNADTLLFLLLFTTTKREKKYCLWLQALKKGEKQGFLEVLYPNIYQILKLNFQ